MLTHNQSDEICIVGAGIWGLCLAHFLKNNPNPSQTVCIYEASQRSGGVIDSIPLGDGILETGPNGFLDSNPATINLCKEIGLGEELVRASSSAARSRFLYLRGQLHKLPSSFIGMAFSPVLSFSAKLRILKEYWQTRRLIPEDESIADFFRAHFGDEIANTLANAFVTGIWGGDAEQLSLPSCFPAWRQIEQETGSLLRGIRARRIAKIKTARQNGDPLPSLPTMWSLKNGLGELIKTLEKKLGPHLQRGAKVNSIELRQFGDNRKWLVHLDNGSPPRQFSRLILACPAHEQAKLLKPIHPKLASELEGITSSPIAVVGMLFSETQLTESPIKADGFGYLTPERDGRPILGVQWCSSIFPGIRAPKGRHLWRALVGGPKHGNLLGLDDDRLLRVVLDELKSVGNWKITPEIVKIIRWKNAIPQYALGHSVKVNVIQQYAKELPGLTIGGSCMKGVAINVCVEQAGLLAQNIIQERL